jgi:16S rRNA (adenine1518-N6/adenine1519-N6)-dimethyltransferase
VVEVGPGHGEVTLELAKYSVQVIAIEKDQRLAESLTQKFKIIEGDILKILPQLSQELKADIWKLVGNIPYYLTGYLFRLISELENKPSLIVFTIQKEVAERICALPPKMNLLAASIQIWAEPEIIDIIPARDFRPEPKVEAAIIKLKIKNEKLKIKELENYYRTAKIIFKQPRKTILNNLSDGLNLPKEKVTEELKKIGLTGQERGQDLSISDLQLLSSNF